VILPYIVEPAPGEFMIMGLNWQNSDYGSGAYGVTSFAMRLICQNGMVGSSQIKQVHLGGRLPDSLTFSDTTYAKDTELMASATIDIVRNLLTEGAVNKQAETITRAAETEVTIERAMRGVRNSLNKGEAKHAKELFEGNQAGILLPEVKSEWRFSNVLSWLANEAESPDRKIELQTLAGKVIAA